MHLERLSKRLNYQFKNKALLKQALTHCSVGDKNYERLEFLGDSILGLVIAHALYEKFPHYTEGQLSRLRAALVKGDMLANVAHELELGHSLYLGQGELKSGGFRRASILADALEAIFAAIFLDGGFEACRQAILNLFKTRLNQESLLDNLKDFKTELQEYLQRKKISLPKYELINIKGEEHDQIFQVTCTVSVLNMATNGQGETRRKAEQEAAEKILKQLK